MSDDCPFCRPSAERLFHLGKTILGMWDAYPVSPGHALLVTKRHISSWFDATDDERREIMDAISAASEAIGREHKPDGFNVGINIGRAAGQTVPHLHVHVIPRYFGDMHDPRGGVRGVIPGKQNYLAPSPAPSGRVREQGLWLVSPDAGPLTTGGKDDPLLPHLRQYMDSSTYVRIAVAFVLPSGVDLIHEHIRDLCDRGGRLQLLTGDYQEVTDPDALDRLLDLQAQYGDLVELRVFTTKHRSFHPKTYIFENATASVVAFIGSSNLTRTALSEGVEWNYRVIPSQDLVGIREILMGFSNLFLAPDTASLDRTWVESYRQRRSKVTAALTGDRVEPPTEPPEPPPEPHDIQKEALTALKHTRAAGAQAGLVVLATGLGKTWLAAFDSNRPEFPRVLFVAHREEILGQAIKTFRRIRPAAQLGLYTGIQRDDTANVLFASVQTLSRTDHLQKFDRRAFDYIVVDEFHHAAANTYRRLIDYFDPKFLLGLTATPERTDGGDLLSLCGGNLVYRCDVRQAIEENYLSPFRYYGVPDGIDYANIPWRSRRFDEEALTNAVATHSRAQNALEQLKAHGGSKAIAFCCSKRHADFMRDFFTAAGLRAASVHSGDQSDPRAGSLERLDSGDLDIVFTVDIFNEGVDIPHIDTVLMLRPTESQLLWTQQFGRGLRKAEGKRDLAVIDYIGNHRSFLVKVQALFDLLPGDQYVRDALEKLQAGTADLPPGCEVTYDLKAIEILRALLRTRTGIDVVRSYYETFRDLHGRRPTASETFYDGYSPRVVAQSYGSWLGFVTSMGDLEEHHEIVDSATGFGRFLRHLESTPMTRSYKMIVVLGMLESEKFPGRIGIGDLARAVERIARRSPILVSDFGPALGDPIPLRRVLEQNPIEAWVGGRGTGNEAFFSYENGQFECHLNTPAHQLPAFASLVRELAEFRLAEYLARPNVTSSGEVRFQCRVSHSSGNPILRLPDRKSIEGIPEGWVSVDVSGDVVELKFSSIAINLARLPDGEANILPDLLRRWFGESAGQPGTRQLVELSQSNGTWSIAPVGLGVTGVELWRSYPRQEIAERFGHDYSRNWGQGVVRRGSEYYLFVTLEKTELPEAHRYGDRFLSKDMFEWQTQNRTTRDSETGRNFEQHIARGITVHLFVRKRPKLDGRGAPFVYCGHLSFIDWAGDNPITIRWRLSSDLPDSLWNLFKPPVA